MINKVTLLGRVGKDPEVRHFENDGAVCNFSLATNRSYKNKNGEKVDETEWHNLVLWRGLAETAEKYVHKGDKLYIEGKIRTRSYDDQAGVKRYVTEIFVDNMEMLTPKGTSTGTFAPNQPASSAAPQSQPIVEPARDDNSADDLPF